MRLLAAVILATTIALAGCGAVDDVKKEAHKQEKNLKREAKKLEAKANKLRKKITKQVNAELAKIKGAVPQATSLTIAPQRRRFNTLEQFMASTLRSVDRYWTRTFVANDIRRPRVKYKFVRPGQQINTRCGSAANDQSAFYCSGDDTIYFGEGIARQIYDNIGSFGVAYALAHEYGHNVQQELGWFASGAKLTTVAPFELQADCLAGDWAYSVYEAGKVDDAQVEEAVQTAYAVGDFDINNPQHHGTPKERSRAFLTGYRSGNPQDCRGFVPS
jgi:uncharacterized protein